MFRFGINLPVLFQSRILILWDSSPGQGQEQGRGEEKKLLEAKIKEVEKLKIAAEDRIVKQSKKQEEIFKEKNNSLKARKKGEKSKSTDQRLIRLETALAKAEDESCS